MEDQDDPPPTIRDLHAAKANGPGALGPLLERYGCRVRAWVRDAGVKNAHDVEDLASLVNLRLLEKLPTTEFDRVGMFRKWVCEVATNLAIDFLRRQGRNPARRHLESLGSPSAGPLDPLSPEPGPPTEAVVGEIRKALEEERRRRAAAIRRLPEPDRELLQLHEEQGMTFARIADVQNARAREMGITKVKTEDAVRMAYRRLVEKIGPPMDGLGSS